MTVTKKDITGELAKLRKFGFKVIVNQENRRKRTGAIGLADYLVIGRKFYWLEAKIGKDTPSEVQDEIMTKLQNIEGQGIIADYITDKNYKEIVDGILGDKL